MHHAETITRRNLPHWYVPGAMHFVTYRLAGTIPQTVLRNLHGRRKSRLEQGPPDGFSLVQHKDRVHKQCFAEYDRYLDRTCPIDWLARPAVAALVRGNLHYHNGSKYHLLAYSVMPNHVHVLLQPLGFEPPARPLGSPEDDGEDEMEDSKSPLAAVMHSLKSYTAHKANPLLGRSG